MFLIDIIGKAFFISTCMAGIAVDIGLGMADLTLDLVIMDNMLFHLVLSSRFMTIFTLDAFLELIPSFNILRR